MHDEKLKSEMLAAIDSEMRDCVDFYFQRKPDEFKHTIYYQLGWDSSGTANGAGGKRLRPLITLAASHALGVDWQQTLSAAAAVEFVHNFSLVHDDIQDRSETRRGRPTIWVKWGEAQAINVGDALLTLAFLEIHRLKIKDEDVLRAMRVLSGATLNLTAGQYLDLKFEQAENIPFDTYREMVEGKTGALFGVCFALTAIVAGANSQEIEQFDALGNQLGIAFQVQDDYLGTFGDDGMTGKPVASDLLERKKTFPILYGLRHVPEFRQYWTEREKFSVEDTQKLKSILQESGVGDITINRFRELYEELIQDFQRLFIKNKNRWLLENFFEGLFDRTR